MRRLVVPFLRLCGVSCVSVSYTAVLVDSHVSSSECRWPSARSRWPAPTWLRPRRSPRAAARCRTQPPAPRSASGCNGTGCASARRTLDTTRTDRALCGSVDSSSQQRAQRTSQRDTAAAIASATAARQVCSVVVCARCLTLQLVSLSLCCCSPDLAYRSFQYCTVEYSAMADEQAGRSEGREQWSRRKRLDSSVLERLNRSAGDGWRRGGKLEMKRPRFRCARPQSYRGDNHSTLCPAPLLSLRPPHARPTNNSQRRRSGTKQNNGNGQRTRPNDTPHDAPLLTTAALRALGALTSRINRRPLTARSPSLRALAKLEAHVTATLSAARSPLHTVTVDS